MREDLTTKTDLFLTLLKPIERDLEVYCRRLIWNPADAPDALQNAVLRAFSAFDRYHENNSFRAWMFTILTREAFALNRKHARIARFEFQVEPEAMEELSGTIEPAGDLASGLSAEALNEALDQDVVTALKTLTDAERAVLLLRAIAGFRYREIGDSLEMPLGSVMGHLSRARHKMRAGIDRAKHHHHLTRTV
jgi:RNA polymerase sigma-70 factor (ECF subfamily)